MPFTLTGTSTANDLGPAWQKVIGKRKLVGATLADFGLGDACIALLEFQGEAATEVRLSSTTTADYKPSTYEVGRGEALCPYVKLYEGVSGERAAEAFIKTVNEEETGR